MIRKGVSEIPAPEFEVAVTTLTKPLSECKVAIVTTAGLRHNGDVKLWFDETFTVLPNDARDLQLSHFSPNFDRAGLTQDLNVAYPADRLDEMAADGTIGGVATNHLSFMGAQIGDFSTITHDTGPAAAQMLIDDGVDVVIFTPV